MEKISLKERLSKIYGAIPEPNFDYYAITFLGKEDGDIEFGCYSHWEGFQDDEMKIETRAASIVKAERVAKLWMEIGQGFIVANDSIDFKIYLLIGGHGLIERSIAENAISELLKPRPSVRTGALGFLDVDSIPETAFNKAPTPRTRMSVLKRDDYRCQICGRRAADYVDIELHVHHIRPWKERGLTVSENLITLCHTCHKGLDPHNDFYLFQLLPLTKVPKGIVEEARKYKEAVRRYREKSFYGHSPNFTGKRKSH